MHATDSIAAQDGTAASEDALQPLVLAICCSNRGKIARDRVSLTHWLPGSLAKDVAVLNLLLQTEPFKLLSTRRAIGSRKAKGRQIQNDAGKRRGPSI
jgi:hypothetical protein